MALEPWSVNVAKLQLQSSLLVRHVPLMCLPHSRTSDKQGLTASGAGGERPPLSLAETRDTQTPPREGKPGLQDAAVHALLTVAGAVSPAP